MSVMSGETMETTPSLVRKELKPARELNTWVPHTHGVRNINTSTRWRPKSGQLFMFPVFITLQSDYLFFILNSNSISFTVKCCGLNRFHQPGSRGLPIVQAFINLYLHNRNILSWRRRLDEIEICQKKYCRIRY